MQTRSFLRGSPRFQRRTRLVYRTDAVTEMSRGRENTNNLNKHLNQGSLSAQELFLHAGSLRPGNILKAQPKQGSGTLMLMWEPEGRPVIFKMPFISLFCRNVLINQLVKYNFPTHTNSRQRSGPSLIFPLTGVIRGKVIFISLIVFLNKNTYIFCKYHQHFTYVSIAIYITHLTLVFYTYIDNASTNDGLSPLLFW